MRTAARLACASTTTKSRCVRCSIGLIPPCLEDLHQRGLLESTLVVAMGEFGRTPELNPRGGRDHWPGCWSIVFAGGGVRGGQIIGVSDAHAAEPKDRPVSPAEVAATIYRSLGIHPHTHLAVPDSGSMPLAEAEPIEELFTD